MCRRPRSDVAGWRRPIGGRLALGIPLALVLSSGALTGDPVVRGPERPAIGVAREVAAVPVPLTGSAAIVLNRPPAPVGDPSRAVDAEQVIAIAGPVASRDVDDDVDEAAEPTGGWFLVGDSTFAAAARHLGGGSAIPGVGFELAPFVGHPNPLRPPPPTFSGTVVIGISIWDVGIADGDAYVHAVARYRAAGHPVLVVEVPERFGPGDDVVTTPAEEARLHDLNRLVETALGCELVPWTVRDVETTGDVDGGDDHVHPTAHGVAQLIDNLGGVADQTCRLESAGSLR